MPTTRRQAAISEGRLKPNPTQETTKKRPTSKGRKTASGQPPTKRAKLETSNHKHVYIPGTIERGHIYFFYRPRVGVEQVDSIDDVRNFHILLIPRPPAFTVAERSADKPEEGEMKVLDVGADAVPAAADVTTTKKHYRLLTVGKKQLPNPEGSDSGGTRKKEIFWATVTSVGDDIDELAKAFEGKTYETKTRGTRHEGPMRLVARGGYAIVNAEAKTPSQRETHLGYHVSHPPPAELGDAQISLGIFSASSFVVQVKNPLAPANNPQQAHSKPADYPAWITRDIFGKSNLKNQGKGSESYGLRFASCETPELLDYKGAQLLLIAARQGEEGLETSLGEGRGRALHENEEQEALGAIEKVFEELGLDLEKFPVESLQGSWV